MLFPFFEQLQVAWNVSSWRDYCEIMFCIGMAACSLQFLHCSSPYLLEFSCSYCMLLFLAWWMQLSVIVTSMVYAIPCGIGILIIAYQKQIQAFFNAPRTVQHTLSLHWIDRLIQLSLHAFHRPCTLVWVIEQSHSLEDALQEGIPLYAELSGPLLDLITQYYHQEATVMLLIDAQGNLKCVQPHYTSHITAHEKLNHLKQLPPWQQYAIITNTLYNTYTLQAHASTRLFTLIANGKQTELTAHQARTLLHQLLSSKKPAQEHSWHISSRTAFDHHSHASSGSSSPEQFPGT